MHCAATDFPTFDEPGHLAAGIFGWQTSSYRLYSVNPPLTKQLAAGLALLARPETRSVTLSGNRGLRPEYDIGDRFARDNAADLAHVFLMARLAGVGWSVLGGTLVFIWSRRLFGDAGGWLSLTVWCFEPNMIAYAHLVTADLPAAVATCAAAMAFSRWLRRPSWPGAALAGVALGIAQLCKFTLVVLYPVWLLVGAWCLWRGPAKVGWRAWLGQLGATLVVSVYVINLGYEFGGSFRPLGSHAFFSRALGGEGHAPGQPANRFRDTWLGELPVPLPEDYLRGVDLQRRDFELAAKSRYNYLRGEWRLGGWWYYYLYALAVKVPLGVWALFLVALALSGRPRPGLSLADGCLLSLPPLAILAVVSSQSTIQSHVRYVLPAVPFGIVLMGRAGAWAAQGRVWRNALVGGLLGWEMISCLAVHPLELSYFNEAVGGPVGGPDQLLGSNADWGQDLWRLKAWRDEHPQARPLHLAYFGHVDPRVCGLEFTLPPMQPEPGWHAMSVRLARGQQAAVPDGRGGYALIPFGGYQFFRHFQPVARAGYSIAVYHVNLNEANRVRRQLGLPGFDEP